MFARPIFRLAGLAFLLVLLATRAVAAADSFRFTATADSRAERTGFREVLKEITARTGGVGAFHISPGDIDPPADNFADLTAAFGSDVVWFPGVGNHEAETPSDMAFIRDHFATLPWIVNIGPPGTETTTYSFDYGQAHFVVLNEYYDGSTDNGSSGEINDELYNWLAEDLANNTQPVTLVFGHEPAFPFARHVGDSLDANAESRDRFWALLEQHGVVAYICGHTHSFSAYRRANEGVWQIDLGNAGNDPGDGLTFADVTVSDTAVQFDIWHGDVGREFTKRYSWVEPVGTLAMKGSSTTRFGAAEGDGGKVLGCAQTDGGLFASLLLLWPLWLRRRRRTRA